MKVRVFVFTLIGFLLFSHILVAQSYRGNSSALADDVRVTLWIDRQQVPIPGLSTGWNEAVSTFEDPAISLLTTARALVSGMIYGYSFSYVPPDRARGVQEFFSIEPRGLIPWGDPRLSIEHHRDDRTTTEVTFRYRLDDDQKIIRQRWLSFSIPDSAGSGSGLHAPGMEGQWNAVESAAKHAVRSHAQGISHDKPAEIRGTFVFIDSPMFRYRTGQYFTDVRIQLRIDSIRQYRIF